MRGYLGSGGVRMILEVTFEESKSKIDVDFREVHEVSDGGFDKGYEVGKEDGYSEGFQTGNDQGYGQGYEVGNQDGFNQGYSQATKEGLPTFCIQNEVTGTGIVTCDYVNEHEHDIEVKLSSDTITDFSGVEVKAIGKNFFNVEDLIDGRIMDAMGNIANKENYCTSESLKLSTGTWTLSALQNTSANITLVSFDSEGKRLATPINAIIKEKSFTLDENVSYVCISVNKSKEAAKSLNIQLEKLPLATEYEAYVESVYTANTDGTVKVKSITPITHLICDTEGVNISAKYYLDKNADYDRFWDNYQSYGAKTNYQNVFGGSGWNDLTFKPKYNIIVVSASNMFSNSNIKNLKELLEKQNKVLDFSKCTALSSSFSGGSFTHIPPIDMINVTATSTTFSGSRRLKELTLLNIRSVCKFNGIVNNCTALEDFNCTGVIGSSISFAHSSLLSNDSVQNIIDHLADLTGATAQTLTLHADVKARMSEEQKAQITAKNWNLA